MSVSLDLGSTGTHIDVAQTTSDNTGKSESLSQQSADMEAMTRAKPDQDLYRQHARHDRTKICPTHQYSVAHEPNRNKTEAASHRRSRMHAQMIDDSANMNKALSM